MKTAARPVFSRRGPPDSNPPGSNPAGGNPAGGDLFGRSQPERNLPGLSLPGRNQHAERVSQQTQWLGGKKPAAYQLVGLGAHAETVTPQRTGLTRGAGAHFFPVASAEHALPPDGAQSLKPRLRLRRGTGFVRQGCKTPFPKGAVPVRAGAHSPARCSLAFKTELADGRQRPAFAAAPGRRICAALVQAFSAPQHFLYFLPLPQGQGSLRPTLTSGLR